MTVLHSFDGATVRRVIDPSRAVVAEHAHDWPMISLFVMGGYRNVTEFGEREIAGPSVVFYRAGVAHKNIVGSTGFEQIEIEFDPAWLGRFAMSRDKLLVRVGGEGGAIAQSLIVEYAGELSETSLRRTLCKLMSPHSTVDASSRLSWVDRINAALRVNPARRIGELAVDIGRSPAWIGPAYRRQTGEGLQQATARFRVERAATLLRETDREFTDIAAEAGFCDQSHMNRVFRRVLNRVPTAVRAERELFRIAATQ